MSSLLYDATSDRVASDKIKMEALSISVIFCLIIYYWCTITFKYWTAKNVAGPKPTIFFGNIRQSVMRHKSIGVIYKELYDQYPDEKVVGFYRMTSPTLLIRDLDLVKEILIKNFHVFPERGIRFSKEGLGDNLFHCDIKTWHALRKMMSPAFSSSKLNRAFHVVDTQADKFVRYFETVASGNTEHEVHRHVQKYTMASAMSTFFGFDADIYNEEHGIIEKAGHYMFKTSYTAEADMLFPNILKKLNLSFYNHVVNRFCYEVVKVAFELNKKKHTIEILMNTMLSMIGENLSTVSRNGVDKELFEFTKHSIAGQVFILFAAGFGTNALSISYVMFELAKNPECQEKLIKEIDDTLEQNNGILSHDALKQMRYLQKVFLEIIRMNSFTNAISREALEDFKIPGTDVVIEKGMNVILSPYAIHRDERLYPNPDQFDPERFSTENCKARHSCAYIPFGAGPRSCLGRRFAYIQFAVAVVKIFSKFRVEPSKKTKIIENYDPMCTLMATKGGVYVNILPRHLRNK